MHTDAAPGRRAPVGAPRVRAAPVSAERHAADLAHALVAFLAPLLPTEAEYSLKEATRRRLEALVARVSPGARLLAFGSMANGFALRNSDMDLCCLLAPAETRAPPELVEVLGRVIRAETDFSVLPLPRARIPIVKISRPPTAEVPCEMACDIGFDNRVALENTRLLLSYALVDPPRVRTLVLFLKVWMKRRKINAPFTGTLSSYGYTLLVLFFLIHVKRPPVLPNLQRVPAAHALAPDDVFLQGHNVYFCDDIAALRREWSSPNTESAGELLVDFFRYFARDFNYQRDVISMRTACGLLTKDACGWPAEHLGVEDPFQAGYNVARTVTRDGLYTIRGEFMRASRLLSNRTVRASAVLDELCAEREDGLLHAPDPPARRGRSAWPMPRHVRAHSAAAPAGRSTPAAALPQPSSARRAASASATQSESAASQADGWSPPSSPGTHAADSDDSPPSDEPVFGMSPVGT